MNNPFSTLTKKEWLLWLCSLFIVLVSNILAANFDPLTLIAALVGVTSLVFAAKGNVWAQVLMIVFSIVGHFYASSTSRPRPCVRHSALSNR